MDLDPSPPSSNLMGSHDMMDHTRSITEFLENEREEINHILTSTGINIMVKAVSWARSDA
jgi:hypothetical protein